MLGQRIREARRAKGVKTAFLLSALFTLLVAARGYHLGWENKWLPAHAYQHLLTASSVLWGIALGWFLADTSIPWTENRITWAIGGVAGLLIAYRLVVPPLPFGIDDSIASWCYVALLTPLSAILIWVLSALVRRFRKVINK